jgi:hypothetical protein
MASIFLAQLGNERRTPDRHETEVAVDPANQENFVLAPMIALPENTMSCMAQSPVK